MNDNKKSKLKEFLNKISTDKEKATMMILDKLEINKSDIASLKKTDKDFTEKVLSETNNLEKKLSKIKNTDLTEVSDLLKELIARVSQIKLQEKIDKDYSPSYKMMIEKLSSVDDKIGGWKFPQYAYTGLRNKSFSPINPAEGVQTTIYSGTATASTSAVKISSISYSLGQGMLVKASDANDGIVYVGSSPVTSSTGMELYAGEAVTIPIDTTNLYIIGSWATPQTVFWTAC